MMMKNPPHPGGLVRHECLEALGLSVTEGAKVLDVSRQALNNLVNEKAALSPDMAVRLSKAFGSTAEFWMRLQFNYDLAEAMRNEKRIKVVPYVKPDVSHLIHGKDGAKVSRRRTLA